MKKILILSEREYNEYRDPDKKIRPVITHRDMYESHVVVIESRNGERKVIKNAYEKINFLIDDKTNLHDLIFPKKLPIEFSMNTNGFEPYPE